MNDSACVSPLHEHGSETLSTLRYANRARNIQNKAEKNVESLAPGGSPRASESERRLQRTASEMEISQLQEQVCYLKQQLDLATAAAAAAASVGTNIPSLDQQHSALFLRKGSSVREAESVRRRDVSGPSPLAETLPSVIPVTRGSRIKPPSRAKTMAPKDNARAAGYQKAVSVVEAESSCPGARTEPRGPESMRIPAGCEGVAALAVDEGQTLHVPTTEADQFCENASQLEIQELFSGSTDNIVSADINDTETQLSPSTHTEGSSADPEAQLGSTDVGPVRSDTQALSLSAFNVAHNEAEGAHTEGSDVSIAVVGDMETQATQQAESFSELTGRSVTSHPENEQLQLDTLITGESNRVSASGSIACDFNRSREVDTVVSCDQLVRTENQDEDTSIRLANDSQERCVLSGEIDHVDALIHADEADAWEPSPLTEFEDITALPAKAHTTSCIEIATQTPEELLPTQCGGRDSENQSGDTVESAELCGGDASHEPEVAIQHHEPEGAPDAVTQARSEPSGAALSWPNSSSPESLPSLVLIRGIDTRPLFTPMDPESSPVHRATTAGPLDFVRPTSREISEHDSSNWLLPSLETPNSRSSNQSEDPESPSSKAPLTRESVQEPDFVLDRRPLRVRSVLSPCDGRLQAKLSLGKRFVQPMRIFDFDDAWTTLQHSRPSSLGKLSNLIQGSSRARALHSRHTVHRAASHSSTTHASSVVFVLYRQRSSS